MTNRIFAVSLIILVVVVSFLIDFPNEIMNFSLALILLTSELVNFYRYQREKQSSKLVKFKSNNWMSSWAMAAFAIYWFSDEHMKAWNILAIAGVLIYGILVSLQNYRTLYEINEDGIKNLYTNKLIPSSEITGADFNNDQISIHTTKYQNELILHASKLESPGWTQLTTELSELANKQGGLTTPAKSDPL